MAHGTSSAPVDAQADRACHRIHELLSSLPLLRRPSDTPFSDGLYFFYERSERSGHGPRGRIVRVGNHPRSDGTLARRIRQHYAGRKNGSVFRKLLGGAVMRARGGDQPCLRPAPGRGHWELQNADVCERCAPVEAEVSDLLVRSFVFRCVAILEREERNQLEESMIGTLALCQACVPSKNWFGRRAYPEAVRRTGLWNVQFTDSLAITDGQLERFGQLVDASQ